MAPQFLRARGSLWLLLCFSAACQEANSPKTDAPLGIRAAPAPTSPLNCDQLAACSDTPCPTGSDCYRLDACEDARCLPSGEVCQRVCGASTCALMESHPMQVACNPGQGPDPSPEAPTCQGLQTSYEQALARVQRCEADGDCGQVIEGSSCGCTRNLIARSDADLAELKRIQTQQADLGCGMMAGICDCPPAEGYVCSEGRCQWNYK